MVAEGKRKLEEGRGIIEYEGKKNSEEEKWWKSEVARTKE